MSQSLPPNDFGNSLLSENCQKLSVNQVVRQYQRQWQQQLSEATVEVMNTPVQFTQSKMNHGGKRLWFTCPQCSRRCGMLFQHPMSENIGCRQCMGIQYRKSRYKGMIEENP